MDKKQMVNRHLQHNSSIDTEEQVRNRRRMAEMEHGDGQPQMSGEHDESWESRGTSPDQQQMEQTHQMQHGQGLSDSNDIE